VQERALASVIAAVAAAVAVLPAPALAATTYFAQYAGAPAAGYDSPPSIGTTILQGSTPLDFAYGIGGSGAVIGSGYYLNGTVKDDNGGTVHAIAQAGPGGGAYLYTEISYTFKMVGPAPLVGKTVPLEVIAQGWATSAGSGYAIGTFNIGGLGMRGSALGPSASGAYGAQDSFTFDTFIDVYPNVDVTVNITADAWARYIDSTADPRGLATTGGGGEAFVDPQFLLPAQYAGIYQIVGVPSVPVPSAAWLFGSALGLLGLRRRAA
jgi:hypothetical protein